MTFNGTTCILLPKQFCLHSTLNIKLFTFRDTPKILLFSDRPRQADLGSAETEKEIGRDLGREPRPRFYLINSIIHATSLLFETAIMQNFRVALLIKIIFLLDNIQIRDFGYSNHNRGNTNNFPTKAKRGGFAKIVENYIFSYMIIRKI